MPLAEGTQIGAYRIAEMLGSGGMGEVYRARDTKLGRDVAIKVLPSAFALDPDRMSRFQREAEILASLNHPGIAHLYGVEEAGDSRALVMELVEGQSPKGPLPFDEAWEIATQVAVALEYAHERGVVHRDLKPANIKVTPEGQIKLLDFGLAKAFGDPLAAGASDDLGQSPTITLGATVAVIQGSRCTDFTAPLPPTVGRFRPREPGSPGPRHVLMKAYAISVDPPCHMYGLSVTRQSGFTSVCAVINGCNIGARSAH